MQRRIVEGQLPENGERQAALYGVCGSGSSGLRSARRHGFDAASPKVLDAEAIELAVRAHVRHTHTDYDRLLSQGWERHDARSAVARRVTDVLEQWRSR